MTRLHQLYSLVQRLCWPRPLNTLGHAARTRSVETVAAIESDGRSPKNVRGTTFGSYENFTNCDNGGLTTLKFSGRHLIEVLFRWKFLEINLQFRTYISFGDFSIKIDYLEKSRISPKKGRYSHETPITNVG